MPCEKLRTLCRVEKKAYCLKNRKGTKMAGWGSKVCDVLHGLLNDSLYQPKPIFRQMFPVGSCLRYQFREL